MLEPAGKLPHESGDGAASMPFGKSSEPVDTSLGRSNHLGRQGQRGQRFPHAGIVPAGVLGGQLRK